ncbi:oxidoreductase [Lecanosticta acicola]|uniref:Oxidoreductase n=1 Tax=Lecanosticta acicola TaxID=111012 RepID=A0AAI8YUW1_9PEZI|nr:oxidoreductase [Lecanosticta acicola]
MAAPLNILIIGNSIAGPTLATFLLLSPHDPKPHITILEKRSPESFKVQSGQNIDIRGSGVTIIRKLGLEKVICDSTTGEIGAQFVDRDNRVWAQGEAGPSGGTSDIEIMRGRLAEIMLERCRGVSGDVQKHGGKGVEFIFGDGVRELEQDGEKVHATFRKSGERRTYDLVVGADGLQSATRKLVWGAEQDRERVKRLGMYGAFFSIPKSEETDTLWRRWFHAPGRRGVMLRPDLQRHRTTLFMYVINEKDQRLVDVAGKGHEEVDAQKELMAEYFQDAGWECDRIIREMRATKDFYYDMVGQVKMEKWVKGRVVLVGDAGYCPSPISGMGTTLALNGAYHLAGALSRHRNDCLAALDAYEKQMRPLVDKAQRLPPGTPHIMNPETAWGIFVMRAVFAFICWTRITGLLGYFTAWEPKAIPVEEYGFEELPELPV